MISPTTMLSGESALALLLDFGRIYEDMSRAGMDELRARRTAAGLISNMYEHPVDARRTGLPPDAVSIGWEVMLATRWGVAVGRRRGLPLADAEDVAADVDDQVRPHAKDVPVVGGVVDLAQRQAVRHGRRPGSKDRCGVVSGRLGCLAASGSVPGSGACLELHRLTRKLSWERFVRPRAGS